MLTPGINFYIPFYQKVVGRIYTNTLQNNFTFNVKSKDNVFADLKMSVQYRVENDAQQIKNAYYSLDDPIKQLEAYIEDGVRSTAPTMTLDELFESKDTICNQVKKELFPRMKEHGFSIVNTLITDINPDPEVKVAMNKINATARLALAAQNEANAKKIAAVTEAQAEKERKKLLGEGVADQRQAILAGYKESIEDFCANLKITPKEAINLTIVSQYMDMVEKMGTSANNKTVFVPYGPSGAKNIIDELRNAHLQGSEK